MRKTYVFFSTLLVLLLLTTGILVYVIDARVVLKTHRQALVVYSAESYDFMKTLIPLFEEKYGIQVHLIMGEGRDLLKQAGQDPRADVVMGLFEYELPKQTELLLQYTSVNNKYTPRDYRNKTGYSTAYVLRGNCLLVNKTLAGSRRFSSYEDIRALESSEPIAIASSATSSDGFFQMVNLMEARGGYDSEEAWAFAEDFVKNPAVVSLADSSQVASAVARGEYVLGLSREDVCAALLREGADIRIVYPREGSLYAPKVAAILRKAPHQEYAKHFLDFMTGKDAQDIIGTLLTSRPIRRDAGLSRFLAPMEEMTVLHVEERDFDLYAERLLEEN